MTGNRWNEIAARFRANRWQLFEELMGTLERPVNLLVIDGNPDWWGARYGEDSKVSITVLNIKDVPSSYPNSHNRIGDARSMSEFDDHEFDVVYTNSVIEHVGVFSEQMRMADEVTRVGLRYFVQTPNRHFPIEPHFNLPFFAQWPRSFQLAVLGRLKTGHYGGRAADSLKTRQTVGEVQLLTKKDMGLLFPDGVLVPERVLGFTKSWISVQGWDSDFLRGAARRAGIC